MLPDIDYLIASYPDKSYVYPASKEDALGLLRQLAERVRQMQEFGRFPEGANGVVIYAMVSKASEICPDGDDLGQMCEGYETILRHCRRLIAPTLLDPPQC